MSIISTAGTSVNRLSGKDIPTNAALARMTKTELREFCKQRGIAVPFDCTKDLAIRLIKHSFGPFADCWSYRPNEPEEIDLVIMLRRIVKQSRALLEKYKQQGDNSARPDTVHLLLLQSQNSLDCLTGLVNDLEIN